MDEVSDIPDSTFRAVKPGTVDNCRLDAAVGMLAWRRAAVERACNTTARGRGFRAPIGLIHRTF